MSEGAAENTASAVPEHRASPLADGELSERQKSVLRTLNVTKGGGCRIDQLYCGQTKEDLECLIEEGLIEHVHTRPMLIDLPLGRKVIGDVAVYQITESGRQIARRGLQ